MKKLIVGLGNPGQKYLKTRHNIGQRVAERLLVEQKTGRIDASVIILTSQGKGPRDYYMNEQGVPVSETARREGVEPEHILVIHDELDLPLGREQLRKGGGSAGHKGVASVVSSLGEDFWRLRLGIGTEEQMARLIPSEEFVLRPFGENEEPIVAEMVEAAVRTAKEWAESGGEL